MSQAPKNSHRFLTPDGFVDPVWYRWLTAAEVTTTPTSAPEPVDLSGYLKNTATVQGTGWINFAGTLATGGVFLSLSAYYPGQVSITTLGTITTGTWHGTAVGAPYGGTGQSAYTIGDILYASTTSALSKLAATTSGYVLTSNGAGVAPSWQAASSGSGDVVGPASAVNGNVVLFNGTTGKLIKDSGLTLSGTNTGDQTSVTGNAGTATALQTSRNIDGQAFNGTANITVIAPGTHAATSKATPVDADELPLVDSAASNVLKKLTWANLKATLFTAWGALVAAGTGKTTPIDADSFAIADSAASNATKQVTLGDLWANNIKPKADTYYLAGSGGASGTPPLSANFTTFGTNITVSDKTGRMVLAVTSFSTAEMRGIVQNSIATPYTIDAHMSHTGSPPSGDESGAGICLSDGTKYVQFSMGSLSSLSMRVLRWTSNTVFSSTVATLINTLSANDYYIRITDDGTTRKFLISASGKDYVQVFSEATNTFLTPTKFGIIVYNKSASGAITSKTAITNWLVTGSVLGDSA